MGRTKVDFVEQLTAQMSAFGVAVHKCNLLDSKDFKLDGRLYAQLCDGFDYEKGMQLTRKYYKEKTVYVYQDDFECRYFGFLLPRDENADYADIGEWMVTVGPYLPEIWEGLLERMTEKYHLTILQESMLKEYYSKIPIVRSAEALENLVFLQANYIYGENEKLEICRIGDLYGKRIKPNEVWKEQKEILSGGVIEMRYRQEEELMAAIAAGDTERAYAAYKAFSGFHMEWRDKNNSLRSAKNMMLVFNTLFRKAVQSAAVHPVHIDKISELYARKIEGVVFGNELLDISYEMIRKYCMLVHNHSLKGYSEVVCDALNYIDCHLSESISLKKMAKHVKVNSSYLSVRFKKEVGQSVIDYVNQKKVENSLLYLATTDMSMAEVAERVGIDDANYFSKLFKKYRGMTPRQYHMLMYSKS